MKNEYKKTNKLNNFINVFVIAIAIIITIAGVVGAIYGLQTFIHKEVKNILNDPKILAKIRPFMIVDSNGHFLMESGTSELIKDVRFERKSDKLEMIIEPYRLLAMAPIVTPNKKFYPFAPDLTITGLPGKGRNWKYDICVPNNEYCEFRIDVIL